MTCRDAEALLRNASGPPQGGFPAVRDWPLLSSCPFEVVFASCRPHTALRAQVTGKDNMGNNINEAYEKLEKARATGVSSACFLNGPRERC